MLRSRLALAFILAAGFSASSVARAADRFILNTEDYPPYQTKDAEGRIVGDNVKIVKELFRRAGIPIEIKLDSWEKSFESARKHANHGVFTTSRSPDREALFHWVGPLSVTRSVLLAKKSKKFVVKQLADLTSFRIGGVTNDSKTNYLEAQGIPVDKVDQDVKNAKRLKADEIDLWATGYISGMKFAKDIGLTDIEEVFVYREDYGYVALNLETKPKIVLELNRIIDEMRSEGKLDATLKFKN
jgi:polar amino acid transport system substrate-binding protein